ncbi:MAG: phosphodiester glycosidase family protein, partial [Moorellales bacterium]
MLPKRRLFLAFFSAVVGVKPDGTLLLVNLGGATIREAAQAMKALGARDAVNLDGGASSGLWFAGKYVAKPG